MSITIEGTVIKVSRKPSKARTTVDIEFLSKNELVVSLPSTKNVDIDEFLRHHSDLIARKYHEYLQRKKVLDGDIILYRGIPHKIVLIPSESPIVKIEQETITVQIPNKANPLIILKDWMKDKTREKIESVSLGYSEFIMKPSKVFITDTRRWGFCNNQGEITYNWQIICLPDSLSEYVIVHELVHLTLFTHQKEFHALMTKLLPDYQQREKDLDQYISIPKNFEIYYKYS